MSVFKNYNPKQAGGVNANAFPNSHPIGWIPNQRNVRANPNIPSQPQRIQPQERGAPFPTSSSDGGTLSPSMSSGSGCGGGCCGKSQASITTSMLATTPSLPVSHGTIATAAPRVQARGVGAIRPGPRGISSRLAARMQGGLAGRGM